MRRCKVIRSQPVYILCSNRCLLIWREAGGRASGPAGISRWKEPSAVVSFARARSARSRRKRVPWNFFPRHGRSESQSASFYVSSCGRTAMHRHRFYEKPRDFRIPFEFFNPSIPAHNILSPYPFFNDRPVFYFHVISRYIEETKRKLDAFALLTAFYMGVVKIRLTITIGCLPTHISLPRMKE